MRYSKQPKIKKILLHDEIKYSLDNRADFIADNLAIDLSPCF
jgi:hypothetical protein